MYAWLNKSTPLGLSAAMARSRSPRRFQCEHEGCGKSFRTNSDLVRHVRTVHEGLKPHICDICAVGFGRRESLAAHKQAVHECLKPHKCDVCQACFAKKRTLVDHKRCVHEGARLYACDLCDAMFGLKHILDDHKRCVHEGLRPFECDVCQVSFGLKSTLGRHKRFVHSTKAQQRIKKREEQTHNALSDNGFTYERELQIKFNSRAARPFSARVDFAILRSWGYVYLEVDELQHKPYPEGHDTERMQLILS